MTRSSFSRAIGRLFDSAWGYRYLRGAFHGGVRLGPIRRALALAPGDSVLDVGCGTGDYSRLVDSPEFHYLGVDLCEEYVEVARRRYGAPFREFQVVDVRSMPFPERSFDQALFLGVMHHLTDEENLAVLESINRIVRKQLVIMDLSPGGWHLLNNFLCAHDRGSYPRRLEAQCALVNRVMKVTRAANYFVRTGIQRYSLITAVPSPGR